MAGTLTASLRRTITDACEAAGVPFVLFQGSYSQSVGASAGTHAGGGAFDLDIRMMSHAQRLKLVDELRGRYCAAWIRTPEYGYHAPPEHIHGICWMERGLSPAAQQQVRDYHAGLNGLANRGPDPHPKPNKDWFDMASKKDLEDVIDSRIDEIAARVNRTLGDFDGKGRPAGPNKDDPQLASAYIRQIRKLVGRR